MGQQGHLLLTHILSLSCAKAVVFSCKLKGLNAHHLHTNSPCVPSLVSLQLNSFWGTSCCFPSPSCFELFMALMKTLVYKNDSPQGCQRQNAPDNWWDDFMLATTIGRKFINEYGSVERKGFWGRFGSHLRGLEVIHKSCGNHEKM